MKIKCEFTEIDNKQLNTFYTCIVSLASIKQPNQEIKSFVGKHIAGKTNRHVEGFCFLNTEVHYMPRRIGKIFPNLKAVAIGSCGLKKITRDDLAGLENIEFLNLKRNELSSLPDDLFEGMKKLKWIGFSYNKLEFVSSQLLRPVLENQLTYVSFWNNPTIDAVFDASQVDPSGFYVDLPDLMKLIDEKCKKPPKVLQKGTFNASFMRGIKDLWTSGQFSDFTIIAGDRKFPVHKCVLSIQSEFFTETFKNEEENSVAELKIEDLSPEAVGEVLKWIYTGQTPDVKYATEVLALTMKLEISRLNSIAENLVLQKLDHKNAFEIFELGHRYKSEKLIDSAFDEIKKFLGQPELDQSLKNEVEKLKKLFEVKKSYEAMLEDLHNLKN